MPPLSASEHQGVATDLICGLKGFAGSKRYITTNIMFQQVTILAFVKGVNIVEIGTIFQLDQPCGVPHLQHIVVLAVVYMTKPLRELQ